MNRIHLSDIHVDDFIEQDIAPCLDYWYRSPSALMESMNVDVDKLPSERRMRELLTILVRWNCSGAAPAPILAIRHMGRAIGVHELTHLSPGCSAVMHAHIWQARYRGIGIGSVSYPAAMRIFFERFSLKCIRFETPIDNLSAQSVKRKLGIEPQGEGTIDMPMLRTPVKTISYRVLRKELEEIEKFVNPIAG
ncbi:MULTISPECIES: GNAT family protein [Burkholderia]|uniref:N-acetyltransferase n=1 Tax=Burkholderia contaminans TaxID=488447 RepID=A0A2S5E539_9BURK|nr:MULTISPECIES: GNAT family protein [Burkholderia]EKS9794147.1 GNAT family N-acetyltransferase [Burkholderia cepacia]EKS9802095.1 GNAT family N-acetyltransferase [Burkholderia cepacia]EKS9810708.1 GNAT family N-acetyltransferase [Burkholderia cepacia]EKS9816398.1 GNAT family N-acetyltransferase [Burkholderia cepacia]EKS9827075.1 GNAT family N-acetyltransferase [Burkholderia cepacia]